MLSWMRKYFFGSETKAVHAAAHASTDEGLARPAQTAQSAGHKRCGNEFLAQGKLDEAAASYREAINADARDADAYLNLGFALSEQQQYAAAERCLRQALEIDPALADAFYILGTVSKRQGNPAGAIENFSRALELKPDFEVIYGDLCQLLSQSGHNDRAMEIIQNGIALYPDSADFHYCLGNLYAAEGASAQAIASFLKTLIIRPDLAEAHKSLGDMLAASARYEEALASYRHALQLQPGNLEVQNNTANMLLRLRRYQEALAGYDKMLQIQPCNAEILSNRGRALDGLGCYEEALASYDQSLQFKPDSALVLFNRGNVLASLNRAEDALASYEGSLQIRPDDIDVLCNCGNMLRRLCRIDDALSYYERMLRLAPDSADAFCNRGCAFGDLHQYQEAFASYAQALQLQPEHVDAHFNECSARLLLGDFELGWQKYEWRWLASGVGEKRDFAQPLWLGKEPLHGKTILLHAEQGFGDTIQFCRYARLVAAKGARVLLETQAALVSLLSGLEGVSQLIVKGEPLPEFDCHCPLLSLPLAFNTGLNSIPADIPYLASDPVRADAWRVKLGNKTKLRVGLVWSGNAAQANDHNRSVPLARLSELVSDQVQFVCLQKEIREGDRLVLAGRKDIICFGDDLLDFSETAALISNMDLVISVCTSVAHLAGAMGKPVWLLLSFNADWRWLLDRNDNPWYPSAKLFRQPKIGDWDSVISMVANEVDLWAKCGDRNFSNELGANLKLQ